MAKNIFNKPIKVGGIPKNKFDLSHEKKLTLNLGKLVPIMCQPVVPGDSFRVNTEIFGRMAPMIAPIMHRVDIYTHYFYVPNRIVWDGWDDFISKEGPGVPVKVPQFLAQTSPSPTVSNFENGSLADYLGLPTGMGRVIGWKISQLPFRAYQTIYNEYYRDQTLSAEIAVPKGDADIQLSNTVLEPLMTLRNRAWEKDYFTTALPNPQYTAGAAAATVSLDGIVYKNELRQSDGTTLPPNDALKSAGGMLQTNSASTQTFVHNIDPTSEGSLLIEELRRANTLQLWLEKQARGGQRLVETIMSHFGVKVPDARVSRPEYLGGGKQHMNISEVLSTYDNTSNDLPQGNMSGHGVSSGRTHGFTHSFPEHGYVIGIMSVLPKSAYQQGIHREWTREDKFDFYWPTFAHLGEQEIKLKELYAEAGVNLETTFGYQMRYSEYKYAADQVHGDFRENLAYWHMGRIFANTPTLSEQFITCDNSETDRVFAVTDPTEHKLWFQIYHNIDALRPMPVFGTPRL